MPTQFLSGEARQPVDRRIFPRLPEVKLWNRIVLSCTRAFFNECRTEMPTCAGSVILGSMKTKLMKFVPVIAGSVLWAGVAFAEPAEPQTGAGFTPFAAGEREQLLERADMLAKRADAMRQEAEATFKQTEAGCYERVLVSSCVSDAKTARTDAIITARKLDAESRRIQREVKLREKAIEDAKRSADATKKAAEDEARAAEQRTLSESRSKEAAQHEAEHQKKLEEGPARAAAEAQRRKQYESEKSKQRAETEAAAAQRAAEAAERRAEIDRRAAEHARKKAEAEAEAQRQANQTTPQK